MGFARSLRAALAKVLVVSSWQISAVQVLRCFFLVLLLHRRSWIGLFVTHCPGAWPLFFRYMDWRGCQASCPCSQTNLKRVRVFFSLFKVTFEGWPYQCEWVLVLRAIVLHRIVFIKLLHCCSSEMLLS